MKWFQAIFIIAAASAFSIFWLLPKTGDPLMAAFVGLAVLLGPAVWIKGSDNSPGARRRT